jgi:hypothetical protein
MSKDKNKNETSKNFKNNDQNNTALKNGDKSLHLPSTKLMKAI